MYYHSYYTFHDIEFLSRNKLVYEVVIIMIPTKQQQYNHCGVINPNCKHWH